MSVSARLATGKPASASARADRYLARIDQRSAHLRPLERRAFLTALGAGMEYRQTQFYRTGGNSEDRRDESLDAFDFTLILTGLAARLAAEPQS